MPRKNEGVTHVRIGKDNLKVLDSVRIGDETNREVIKRLLEDYDYRGIRRELVKKFSDIQQFVTNYIHEDLHYSLELLKVIIFNIEGSENKLERAEICKILNDDLYIIHNDKIPKLLLKNKPDKK